MFIVLVRDFGKKYRACHDHFCNVRTFKSRELHDGYRKLQAPDLTVFFFWPEKIICH